MDDSEEKRAAAELRAVAEDPAVASEAVVRLARGGCPRLELALRALSRSQISGRLLLGLVEDAVAAAPSCADAAALAAVDRVGRVGPAAGPVAALARARLLADRPDRALAALPGEASEPAVHLQRAEILAALGRPAEALAAWERFSASAPGDLPARAARAEGLLALGRADDAARAAGPPPHLDPALREAYVAAVAAAGRERETAAAIASAPVPERPELARRAVEVAPVDALARLGEVPGATADLVASIADRLESKEGAAAVVSLRRRAADAEPRNADRADALARALSAAGLLDQAVDAWDRAATLAPAQPAYSLAPIRALAAAGHGARARRRARALAATARAAADADRLLTASAGAAAAGDEEASVVLVRDAIRVRPGDGRLVFALGERLAGAGDRPGAAGVWAELLACGAHGRPWHRHEVAGRLVGLASDAASTRVVQAALEARRACAPVDPEDLAGFVALAKQRLVTP
ncbi:MAG TPA: hypothetical protein VK698_06090 [Kofleriaceae bacterium]|nr:hypothetical protein [Kofleriaceae bacterium]